MSHSKENVAVDSVKLRKEFENRGLSLSAVARMFGRANSYFSHKLQIPIGYINESDVMMFQMLMDIDIREDYSFKQIEEELKESNEFLNCEGETEAEIHIDIPKEVKLAVDDETLEKLYNVIFRAVKAGVLEGLK